MATKKKTVKVLSFDQRRQAVDEKRHKEVTARVIAENNYQQEIDKINEEERQHNLQLIYDNVDVLLKFVTHSESDGSDENCVNTDNSCSEYCPRCALLLLKKHGVKTFGQEISITVDVN